MENQKLNDAAMKLAIAIAASSRMPQLVTMNDAMRELYDTCMLNGAAEPVPFEPGSFDFATQLVTAAVSSAVDALGAEEVRQRLRGPTKDARDQLIAHTLRAAAVEARSR